MQKQFDSKQKFHSKIKKPLKMMFQREIQLFQILYEKIMNYLLFSFQDQYWSLSQSCFEMLFPSLTQPKLRNSLQLQFNNSIASSVQMFSARKSENLAASEKIRPHSSSSHRSWFYCL
jgi:hypothetical protein